MKQTIYSPNFNNNNNAMIAFFNGLNKNSDLFVKSKLHETCSYTAMYPAKLANLLITKYSKVNDYVFDPFSGRGTTLLESRLANRKSFASDLNPLAFVLSRSKSVRVSLKKILNRVLELEKEYSNSIYEFDKDEFCYMSTYFNNSVLKQLYFLKNKLGNNWRNLNSVDNFVLSILLGILHGPSKKDGTSSYCSISMRNTISMSKRYVDNYVMKHKLKFPTNDNVFEKLRAKVKIVFDKSRLDINFNNSGKIKLFNALKCNKCFPNKKYNLILTSPPYLNVFNYTRENWIRIWLLGYRRETLSRDIKLDDNHKLEDYKKFLVNFLNSAEKSLATNGKIIIVIGDIKDKFNFINIWNEIGYETNLMLSTHYQDYEILKKMTTRNNGSKSSKNATRVDNICVFERIAN